MQQYLDKYHNLTCQNNHLEALRAIEGAMILVDPMIKGSGLPNCTFFVDFLAISGVSTASLQKAALKWRLWRGETLLACSDISEAAQVALAILRIDSRNSDALLLRAKTMHLLDSHPVSTIQQFIVQSLTFDPDNKKARLFLKYVKSLEAIKTAGNEAFKAGDYDKSLLEYGNFLEYNTEEYSVIKAKVLSNRATVFGKVKYILIAAFKI